MESRSILYQFYHQRTGRRFDGIQIRPDIERAENRYIVTDNVDRAPVAVGHGSTPRVDGDISAPIGDRLTHAQRALHVVQFNIMTTVGNHAHEIRRPWQIVYKENAAVNSKSRERISRNIQSQSLAGRLLSNPIGSGQHHHRCGDIDQLRIVVDECAPTVQRDRVSGRDDIYPDRPTRRDGHIVYSGQCHTPKVVNHHPGTAHFGGDAFLLCMNRTENNLIHFLNEDTVMG